MPDYPPSVLAAATTAIRDELKSSREVEPDRLARAALEAASPLLAGEPVTEHAHEMSGGGYHVWNTEPYIEEIYPLARKIKAGQRFGGKVYRRRVIVVEDWTEVAPVPPEGEEP